MSLLDLPTELIDQIFSYLDWDRAEHLCPTKVDITAASCCCKQLRKALLPLVFRDVVMRLRWLDDDLVEPCLYRLHVEHPELAQHIRCVYIRTEYEQCAHCAEKEPPTPFRVPEDVSDWLNPSSSIAEPSSNDRDYRTAVDELAQKLLNPVRLVSAASEPVEQAESAILGYKNRGGVNPDLDALSIVMLCIPSTTKSLIFKSLTDSYMHESKNNFAVRLLATAINVHQARLEELTMVSNAAAGRLTMSRRALARLGTGGGELDAISPDVLRNLKVRRLVLAINDGYSFRNAPSTLMTQSYMRWHQMSHCLQDFELRYCRTNVNEMLGFVKGFQALKKICIQDCVLDLAARQMIGQREDAATKMWLILAIELRRAFRHLEMKLRNLYKPSGFDPLPDCAVLWMCSAVDTGAVIDADREARLLEDFSSFMPLWWAERERGDQAMNDWTTARAKLSDEAMSRRWA